jgi:hypothetical protein
MTSNRTDTAYSGSSKHVFRQRLRDDWKALADVLEVKPYEPDAFAHGDEPRALWEWLERRGELSSRLPSALREIGRGDLADTLAERRD